MPMIISRTKARLGISACILTLFGATSLLAREAPATPGEGSANAPVAAAATSPQAPVAVKPVPATPGLWKIADDDTTIYLFGTIHILPEATDWYSGPVAKAFNSSKLLVTEAIIDSPADLQKEFLTKAVRTDGKTLREALPEKERSAYEKAMTDLGVPVNAFDRFEPWYAALLLSSLPMQKAGYKSENGVESQIEALAKEHGLAREALETAAYQIDLFDSLPADAQENYLGEVLDQLPTMRDDLARLIAAWKAGRAEELAEILNAGETDKRVRQVLLTNRNAAWAKWLKARLDEPGTVFVAVGAGHLAGEDSVQEQLAAQGVPSTRLQ